MKTTVRTRLFFLSLFILFISCSSESEDSTPEPDVTAPSVDFSIAGFSNSSNSEPIVVSNQIEVNINAQDSGGIAKVEAFIDNQKVGEDASAPYQITIDISNYTSKIAQTAKFKDYTLKIVVTDTSGNTTSKEQIINIDNELPMISDVSLIEGTIIGGAENKVTFNISDNEGLNGIKTYLNNELLSEITDANYEVYIDTQSLSDGENTLKIEAIDLAENTATFEIVFIVDNSGPNIILESLAEGQILNETIIIAPNVSDELSEIKSVEILFANQSLMVFDDLNDLPFNLNPESLPVGLNTLTVKALDNALNESFIEIPLEIHRKLITINFPLDFLQTYWESLYVFASGMDGKLLAVERIYNDTQKVILSTSNEISTDTEFMLTFANYNISDGGNHSDFVTIQNLKPSNNSSDEMNISVAPKFVDEGVTSIPAPISDGSGEKFISATGFGYNGTLTTSGVVNFSKRRNIANSVNTNNLYFILRGFNGDIFSHAYAMLDYDKLSEVTFDTDAFFTTEGVEERTYQPIRHDGAEVQNSDILVFGYLNEDDFQNDVYHKIGGTKYGFIPPEGITYFVNSIFDKYRYEIILDDYFTRRTGQPLASYTSRDWTIDYAHSNNEISIIKSGSGHKVGKISMWDDTWPPEPINGEYVTYTWDLVFDSEKMDNIIIPEIPTEIQSWGFNHFYENNNLEVQQVEIKAYESISSYLDYYNQILKNNRYSHTVSPNMESKFKNSYGETRYYQTNHFLID